MRKKGRRERGGKEPQWDGNHDLQGLTSEKGAPVSHGQEDSRAGSKVSHAVASDRYPSTASPLLGCVHCRILQVKWVGFRVGDIKPPVTGTNQKSPRLLFNPLKIFYKFEAFVLLVSYRGIITAIVPSMAIILKRGGRCGICSLWSPFRRGKAQLTHKIR